MNALCPLQRRVSQGSVSMGTAGSGWRWGAEKGNLARFQAPGSRGVSLGAERMPRSLLPSQRCPGTLTPSSTPHPGDMMRSLSHRMGFQAETNDRPWRDRLPGRALTWRGPRGKKGVIKWWQVKGVKGPLCATWMMSR